MFLVRGSFLIAWRTTGKRTSHSTIKPVSSTISSNSPTRPESYPRCPCTRYSTNVHDRIRVTTVSTVFESAARARSRSDPASPSRVGRRGRACGRTTRQRVALSLLLSVENAAAAHTACACSSSDGLALNVDSFNGRPFAEGLHSTIALCLCARGCATSISFPRSP